MIEAFIGLLGVVVGSAVTISRDVWATWFERRRNGSFAAIRIVGVLDQFVETCIDVVFDDGTFEGRYAGRTKDGEEYAIAQAQFPSELAFPDDVIWKDLGNSLMYRVLMLPAKVSQANRYIDYWGENSSPPGFDEVFDARQESCAELGMEALELASELRAKFSIPEQTAPAWNPDWEPKKFLLEKKRSIEERRARSSKTFEVSEDG